MRKSDEVRALVQKENFRKALEIAKGFRLGITSKQSGAMALAYECMVHERFYLSIGTDIQKAIHEGVETIVGLYGRNEHDIHQ